MSGSGTTYVDQNGDAFKDFGIDGTVTLAGSGFKNPIAVTTFAFSVVWLTCFTVLLFVCIRVNVTAEPGHKAKKYLRSLVMGASIFFMLMAFAIDVYNRVIHEKQETKPWWILVITIPQSIFIGAAHGLLIAFMLWQFTPALMFWADVSEGRAKHVIRYFKVMTWFISVADAADKIVTAVLYVLQMLKVLNGSQQKQDSKGEVEAQRFSTLGSTLSSALFNGLYLMCIVVFSIAALAAIRGLDKTNALENKYRWALGILTTSILLRSTLDFAWSLTFQVGSIYLNHSIVETKTTSLINLALYGFFSVVCYASIIRVAALPDPERFPHSEINFTILGDKNPDKNTAPSATTGFLLGGVGGVMAARQMQKMEKEKEMTAQVQETTTAPYYDPPPMNHPSGQPSMYYAAAQPNVSPPRPATYGSPPNSYGSPPNTYGIPQNPYGGPSNPYGSPQNIYGSQSNIYQPQHNTPANF